MSNKNILDYTVWNSSDNTVVVSLRDILEYFQMRNIKPIKMKTEEIFYKLSNENEILHIIEKGGKDSEERVKNANLDYPITVVKRDCDIEYVLDGNHRLQKAKNTGEKFIEINVLDLNDPSIPEEFWDIF